MSRLQRRAHNRALIDSTTRKGGTIEDAIRSKQYANPPWMAQSKSSTPVAGQLHTSKANPNLAVRAQLAQAGWSNERIFKAERELKAQDQKKSFSSMSPAEFEAAHKKKNRRALGDIRTGPKGGQYYISKTGTKVYVK